MSVKIKYHNYKNNEIIFVFPAILLGSIKVPYTEIKRRILEVDEDNLSSSILENLIKYMPEPSQMKQIEKLQDQYSDLAEPEQFAVTVSRWFKLSNRKNREYQYL